MALALGSVNLPVAVSRLLRKSDFCLDDSFEGCDVDIASQTMLWKSFQTTYFAHGI